MAADHDVPRVSDAYVGFVAQLIQHDIDTLVGHLDDTLTIGMAQDLRDERQRAKRLEAALRDMVNFSPISDGDALDLCIYCGTPWSAHPEQALEPTVTGEDCEWVYARALLQEGRG